MELNTRNMLEGKPYTPATAELNRYARQGHRLSHDYNLTYDDQTEQRAAQS